MVNKKIKVVDSIMGSGKTSWAIDYMNENTFGKKFIYITPFLNEVTRIKEQVKNRKFYEPTNKNKKGSKLEGLKKLIVDGKDIVSTHALFKTVDDEIMELLQVSGYTLILDEVMDVIELMQTRKDDIPSMLELDLITIKEHNKVIWNEEKLHYDGAYNVYKNLALSENLYIHTRDSKDENKKKTLLVWTFPSKVFELFDEVYILTYLFSGQFQCYYYQMFDFSFEYYSVENKGERYELAEYKGSENENRQSLKELISIYSGVMNKIGGNDNALSSNWLKNTKHRKLLEVLKRNTESYFRTVGTKSSENAWTTIKGDVYGDSSVKVVSLLKGTRYTKGFLPCNARATNDYANKISMAYLYNRFMNPMEKGFFQDKGIKVNQELWALSELLQWIWRSRIRNGEPINLFIPSRRMRNLLEKYLNYEM